MGKRAMRGGQGFSLYGLQAEISQAVDILTDALTKQGVDVNQDSLLLQIQNVVKSIGDTNYQVTGPSYSYMQASDEAPPYSMAADLLAVGYNQFMTGNKKEGIKSIISAMEYEDFEDITTGLLAMNTRSVQASEDDTDESDESDDEDSENYDDDDDSDNDDEDDDENDNDDEDDLNDDDIDDLLDDSGEETVTATDKEENDVTEDDEEEEPKDNKASGKAPMAEEDKNKDNTTVTASVAQRAIANKLSMNGGKVSTAKSKEFIKTITNKVSGRRAA